MKLPSKLFPDKSGVEPQTRKARSLEAHSFDPIINGPQDPFPMHESAPDDFPDSEESGNGYSNVFAMGDEQEEGYPREPARKEVNSFQDRLLRGKVKLCPICGGVMTKGTRMLLSGFSAFVVVVLGVLLMGAYGWATNFYSPPWFLKFVLPAAYYIGSLFIGVGVLIFFLREKVWKCHDCREIAKR
ncbi:hypothetical protein ACFL2Q_20180 [Thermodesulfobacteriota bacterium]